MVVTNHDPVVADCLDPGAFVKVPAEPASDVAVDHVTHGERPHHLFNLANTYSVFGTAITVSKVISESSSKLQ